MAIFSAIFVPNLLIYNLLILNQFLIGMTGLVKNWPKTTFALKMTIIPF